MSTRGRGRGSGKSQRGSPANKKTTSGDTTSQNAAKQPPSSLTVPIMQPASGGSQLAHISGEVPLTVSEMPPAGVKFQTNHFRVNLNGGHIYRYDCADPVRKVLPKDANANPTSEPTANSTTTSIAPRVPARVRRRVFVLLLKQLTQKTGTNIASNYKNQLICRQKISDLTDDEVVEVLYYDEDQLPDDSNLKIYTVTVRPPVEINAQRVVAYLRSGAAVIGPDRLFASHEKAQAALTQTIDAMNVMFSQRANEHSVRFWEQQEPDVTTLGQNRFYPHRARALPIPSTIPDVKLGAPPPPVSLALNEAPGGLMGLIGSFRSVRDRTGFDFLLNINAVTGCFYQPCRLDALINLHKRDMIQVDWRAIDRFIKGLRVQTKHREATQHYQDLVGEGVVVRERIFTVNGIALSQLKTEKQRAVLADPPWASNVSFQLKVSAEEPGPTKAKDADASKQSKSAHTKGKTPEANVQTRSITIAKYWKDIVGRDIDDQDIIVRVGNDSRPMYYPARELEVLPGQPFLNTVSMVREACRAPAANFEHINLTSKNVFGFAEVNTRFNLAVGTNLLTASANRLPQPQIVYQNSAPIPGSSRWNFRNCKFATPAKLAGDNEKITYACIQFVPQGSRSLSQDHFRNFQATFQTASQNVGLQLACAHGTQWISQNNQLGGNIWSINYNDPDTRTVQQALTT